MNYLFISVVSCMRLVYIYIFGSDRYYVNNDNDNNISITRVPIQSG